MKKLIVGFLFTASCLFGQDISAIYSANPVSGDTQYGLDWRQALGAHRLADENSFVVSYPLTVDTVGAYAAGDQWALSLTCTNILRITNGCVTIHTITIYNPNDNAPVLTIIPFSRPFTTNSLNSAWAETNMTYALPHISVAATNYLDLGTTRQAAVTGLAIPVSGTWTNRNIYLGIIAQDTSQMTNQPTIIIGGFY